MENLSTEVLLKIFGYLDEVDLCRLSQVCTKFRDICDDWEVWREVYRNYRDIPQFGRANEITIPSQDSNPDSYEVTNPWKKRIMWCMEIYGINCIRTMQKGFREYEALKREGVSDLKII